MPGDNFSRGPLPQGVYGKKLVMCCVGLSVLKTFNYIHGTTSKVSSAVKPGVYLIKPKGYSSRLTIPVFGYDDF